MTWLVYLCLSLCSFILPLPHESFPLYVNYLTFYFACRLLIAASSLALAYLSELLTGVFSSRLFGPLCLMLSGSVWCSWSFTGQTSICHMANDTYAVHTWGWWCCWQLLLLTVYFSRSFSDKIDERNSLAEKNLSETCHSS